MAAPKKELRPVQIFLDTKKFITVPLAVNKPRGHKDFYAGNDRGFAVQKGRIRKRLTDIAHTMQGRAEPAGFIRVQMKDEALAKSYRPLGTLFTEQNRFAFVGTDRVGEIIFQATPQALEKLDAIIDARAEATPKLVEDKITHQLVPQVSQYRSEVGAIDSISLYDARDRVPFSAEEAVAWMKQPGIIGGYVVELFRPKAQLAPDAIGTLVESLATAFRHLPFGVITRSFLPTVSAVEYGEPALAISVQLTRDPQQKEIALPFTDSGHGQVTDTSSAGKRIQPNFRVEDHRAVLGLLASQALVRNVE
ncbi:MAG: hypothetical protein J0H61_14045, partial [Alphaproteobacteria bacterium]|nr:hypothetical protein [Alphaproteobacteria bacterium]